MRFVVSCISLLWLTIGCSLAATAASDLRRDSITSQALQRDLIMLVYLPEGYDSSTQKYPVLYLLHGAGDTEETWIVA